MCVYIYICIFIYIFISLFMLNMKLCEVAPGMDVTNPNETPVECRDDAARLHRGSRSLTRIVGQQRCLQPLNREQLQDRGAHVRVHVISFQRPFRRTSTSSSILLKFLGS